MTAKELRDALALLGWTRADLARAVSVSDNTVSNWATGGAKVPGPAAAYLKLRLTIARGLSDLDARMRAHPPQ